MFDNIWTNTKEYANYANVPPTLVRNYPTSPIDPRLNFPPKDSYQDRLVPLIDHEPAAGWIDVDMYRITLARPVDALIRANRLDGTISQPANSYAQYAIFYSRAALEGKTYSAGQTTDHNSTIVNLQGNFEDALPAPVVDKNNVNDPNLWGNSKSGA